MKQGYWFRSNLFQIHKGEDEETNPGCYGKELGKWLCKKLENLGYNKVELIPEDWGWCIMCSHSDYMLWVGCSSMQTDETYDSGKLLRTKNIVWHVFPVVEVPVSYFKSWVKKLLGKLDIDQPLNKLNNESLQILKSEPSIEMCEEP